jgi:hypothetical protein
VPVFSVWTAAQIPLMPRGAMPTTHIFKLPMALIGAVKLDMRDSVENEWLCSLILQEFGIRGGPSADAVRRRQGSGVQALRL